MNKEKDCYNCKKKGHIAADCWAKGGGKEGQGPKGRKGAGKKNRANQAEEINSSLNNACYMANNSWGILTYNQQAQEIKSSLNNTHDVCYMANNTQEISKYDWLLDSSTTSHVCPIQDAFTEFYPVKEILNSIGEEGTPVTGRGTAQIKFEFDGKNFIH